MLFLPGSKYSKNVDRPFSVRYNPYTQGIDLLNSPRQVRKGLASSVEGIYSWKNLMKRAIVEVSWGGNLKQKAQTTRPQQRGWTLRVPGGKFKKTAD